MFNSKEEIFNTNPGTLGWRMQKEMWQEAHGWAAPGTEGVKGCSEPRVKSLQVFS